MSRARHILAVVAVTTALCANQVVSAAPLPRPHVTEIAAHFVGRFSQTFRRTVPNSVRGAVRQQVDTVPSPARFDPERDAVAFQREFSPFQFRLPPPVL